MYYVAPETPMMSSLIADCPDLVSPNILDKSTPVQMALYNCPDACMYNKEEQCLSMQLVTRWMWCTFRGCQMRSRSTKTSNCRSSNCDRRFSSNVRRTTLEVHTSDTHTHTSHTHTSHYTPTHTRGTCTDARLLCTINIIKQHSGRSHRQRMTWWKSVVSARFESVMKYWRILTVWMALVLFH